MNEALLVSNVLLWIAVVALAAVVVALVRQIGVLHERVFPVGALVMPGGPKVGAAAPTVTTRGFEVFRFTPAAVSGVTEVCSAAIRSMRVRGTPRWRASE